MTTSIDYMNEIPPEREINDTFRGCLSKVESAFGALSPGWQHTLRLRDSPPYPETVITGPNTVSVWVTKGRSRVGYLFEAGHEAVHCLNPSLIRATYLEEAVAGAFSQSLVFGRFGQLGLERTLLTRDYNLALEMAVAIDRDVVRLGRRLRGHVGSLRKVPPEAVRELYPQAPDSTVQHILKMFPWQSESESTPGSDAPRAMACPRPESQ